VGVRGVLESRRETGATARSVSATIGRRPPLSSLSRR
jgi:hypothetical protein